MNKYTFPPTCSGFVRRLCGRACRIPQGVRIAVLWYGEMCLVEHSGHKVERFLSFI